MDILIKTVVFFALISANLIAQTASEFQKQQMQDFNNDKAKFDTYKKSTEDEYNSYKKAQMKIFEDYKKELGVYWEDPELSTKKVWVAYTEDKKTKTNVDFENETIVVQTIASSQKEAKQKLQIALAKAVTVDTQTLQNTDPLEIRLNSVKKPKDIIDSNVDAKPILSTVIFNNPPTKKVVVEYVNQNVTDNQISVKNSNKIKDSKIYSIRVQMPKDAMLKRSKIYYSEVQKQANSQELPMSLVFAIMHSESSFNPRARSHIPAYGLMQIVPVSAGIDAYLHLYKEKRLVTSAYLYNSVNNITMGSAYLHILYYKYLKEIKNSDSRLYCTIAAYNTGTGNIAWAFTKDYNINKAVELINGMSPEVVYNKLIRNLKHDEAKNYLDKVSKRMSAYHKVYGG